MTLYGTGDGVRLERRFLLPAMPRALASGAAWLVEERYLAGTRLALRRAVSPMGPANGTGPQLTLGQRVRTASGSTVRVTLVRRVRPDEYAALLRLPSDVLVWRRYPVRLAGWPCSVDVFAGELSGLVLAQAAFESVGQPARFPTPVYAVAEVTGDGRFNEERLARMSASTLARTVSEYGMLLR